MKYKKILKSVLLCGAAIVSMSTVNTLADETEPLQNFSQQMDSMDNAEASNFLRSYGLRNGTVAGSKVSVSRTSSGFTVQNPKENVESFTANWITDTSKIKLTVSNAFYVNTPIEFSFKIKQPLTKGEELLIPLNITGTIFNTSSSYTYEGNITQNNGTNYTSQDGSFSYNYDNKAGNLKVKALDDRGLTDYSGLTLFLNNNWIPVPLRENPMPLKGGVAGNYGTKGSGATIKVKVGDKETSETLTNTADIDFTTALQAYNNDIFGKGAEYTTQKTASSSTNFLANFPLINQLKKGKTKNLLDESMNHYEVKVVSNAKFKNEEDIFKGLSIETYIPIGSSSSGAPITAIAQNATVATFPEFKNIIKNASYDKAKQIFSFDLSNKKADWQALGADLLKNEAYGSSNGKERASWITDYLKAMANGNVDQNTTFSSYYPVQGASFVPVNNNFSLKVDVTVTNSASKAKTTNHIIVDPVKAGNGDTTKAAVQLQLMDSEGNPIGELQTPSYYGSGDAYTVTPPVIKGYRLLNVNPQSLIDKLGITNVVDQQGKFDSSNIGNIYNVVYEYVKEVPLTYSVIDDTTGETLEEHQDLATGALNQEANIKENQDKLKAIQESYKSKGYLLGDIENGNLPVPTDEKGYNVTLHLSHGSHQAVIDGKSKAVTQTIHYQGAGNETPEDNIQVLTFTSKITQTIDNVTDRVLAEAKPVWPEQQSTRAVDSPILKDYAADKESVPSMNYNYDSEDVALEVTYSSTLAPITYSVIDDTAGKTLEDKKDFIMSHVLEPINTSEHQDKLKSIVKSYTDKGYVLGNIENEELPVPEDTKGYDVTLHLTHGTSEKVIDGESKTVTQKIQYKGAGDKTPEEDIQKFVFTSTLTQTIDNVTGDVVSTSGPTWSDKQHSKAVKTPEIDGYSSDIATVKSYDYDHETKDKTITVSYQEIPPVVKEVKKAVKNILPQTGTEAEIGLAFTGVALVLIAGALYVKSKLRKKNIKNDD
ncbi:mucin-binding protein [Lactococcus garvieae]|uniref:mucin-binding protein n=1 Tax=Lactococcus garvieae TaxID=1363 RepID=UPI00254ADC3C|nr:LPXTG cell wall anchor domain-containing protein [Lactococcus garvieae]